MVQSAIRRVHEYDTTWDPAKDPDLFTYLMSSVNSLLANERTRASARRNVSLQGNAKEAESVSDDRAFSVDKLDMVMTYERRIARLQKMLARDLEASRVLELTMAGEDTPAEMCRATGWSLSVVNAARLRMQRHAALTAKEFGDDFEVEPHDETNGEDDPREERM